MFVVLDKEAVNLGSGETPSIGSELGSVMVAGVEGRRLRGKAYDEVRGTTGGIGRIGCTITFVALLFSEVQEGIVFAKALWSWYLTWLIRSWTICTSIAYGDTVSWKAVSISF